MSFKIFIYYCAVLGGWAALLVGCINHLSAVQDLSSELVKTALIGSLLGLVMGATVGGLDALLNAIGKERLVRAAICALIGLFGGGGGAFLGQLLANQIGQLIVVGWVLAGVAIGASMGVYDLLRAIKAKEDSRASIKKICNGILGGIVGGLIGGICNSVIAPAFPSLALTSNALAFVVLGTCIGLFIGLAQVFLKEAWLKVEAGFRAGQEMMLTKDETTIGRAESCDLGLFGDNTIEKLHTRIKQQHNRYHVEDAGTPGGTYVNDQRVAKIVLLRNGDMIRIGNSILRFGERAKN